MKYITVTFLPWNLSIDVLLGITIHQAAQKVGIVIATPCGGHGACGKCMVKVCSGNVAASEITEVMLSEKKVAEGYRLACKDICSENCTVEIPKNVAIQSGSDDSTQILTDSSAQQSDVIQPLVKKEFFDFSEMTTLKIVADKLMSTFGCQYRMASKLQMELADILTESKGKATALIIDDSVVAIEKGNTANSLYGIAFDIGTTTLAAALFDLRTGQQRCTASRLNPQTRHGDDVISRIQLIRENPEASSHLQKMLINAMNEIIADLKKTASVSSEQIYDIALCGNTAMQQIACGIDSSALGQIPFRPAFHDAQLLNALSLGLDVHTDARVYVFGQIGGFVGGDTTAGLLASGAHTLEESTLYIDIGTNGEIVLCHKGRIYAASTAAGPAFEGARIERGMRAANGAIEHVCLETGDLKIQTIGGKLASGICGSGLIDAVACMLDAGVLDMMGTIAPTESIPMQMKKRCVAYNNQPAFVIASASESVDAGPLLILQNDIRQVQLAMGAIRAGIALLLKKAGITESDLSAVLLAGAFGNFINCTSAIRIGLLPALPIERIHFLGNTALAGAGMALTSVGSRTTAQSIQGRVEHVELSNDPLFQEQFGMAMMFPG